MEQLWPLVPVMGMVQAMLHVGILSIDASLRRSLRAAGPFSSGSPPTDLVIAGSGSVNTRLIRVFISRRSSAS